MSPVPPDATPTMMSPDEGNRRLAASRRPLIGQIAQVDAVGIVDPNLAAVRGVATTPDVLGGYRHRIEVETLTGERRLLEEGAVGREWDDYDPDITSTYGDNLRAQRIAAGEDLKQARRAHRAKPVADRDLLRAVKARVRVLDDLLAEHNT